MFGKFKHILDSGKKYLDSGTAYLTSTLSGERKRMERETEGISLDSILANSQYKELRGLTTYVHDARERVKVIEQRVKNFRRTYDDKPETLLSETTKLIREEESRGIYIETPTIQDITTILSRKEEDIHSASPNLDSEFQTSLIQKYNNLVEQTIGNLYTERGITDKGILTETINRVISGLQAKIGIEFENLTQEDVSRVLEEKGIEYTPKTIAGTINQRFKERTRRFYTTLTAQREAA